jgi:uncharacterized protein
MQFNITFTTMETLVKIAAKQLQISQGVVSAVAEMLDAGATVPFMARYRKERTNDMDEVQLLTLVNTLKKLTELEKRKETMFKNIAEQGGLTDKLKQEITDCWDELVLEDLYLPFKRKKTTKAAKARALGLEPVATKILQQHQQNIYDWLPGAMPSQVNDQDEALEGARHIIAEWVNEDQKARAAIRQEFEKYALLKVKVVKSKEEAAEKYQDYFDFKEPLHRVASHRLLAVLRGETEGFLKIQSRPDEEITVGKLKRFFVKGRGEASNQVVLAVEDAYKRLLMPSLENEVKNLAKQKADATAIDVFAKNLRQLLLTAPLGQKRVLAIDPGFKSGCKVVCLDAQGGLLHNETIYPHPPQNDRKGATSKLSSLINAYKIEAMAIGNGTAGRETEGLVKSMRFERDIEVFMVNENGASIYSASTIARQEFPDYDVTVRGSVSIGRRLMDPLAELVKIDPKSIGVGQYQHDVDQSLLKENLESVVESCVNKVGVNVNTASKHLLSYVAGVGPVLAENIVAYRKEIGSFKNRKQLLKVPRLGAKVYEQCAGFLRVKDGDNPLDNSSVHPEQYQMVGIIAKHLGCKVEELIGQDFQLPNDVMQNLTSKVGAFTINDIIKELKKPGVDPRQKAKRFSFDENVRTIGDLRIGMELLGLVSNITQFGAFVDIGVKQDGLVHISQLADRFVSDPHEVVVLNQEVRVKVLEIDEQRKRVALTMKL